MSERFFVATPIHADHATLEGPEARHLAQVMRAQVGDAVILFDGSGDEFVAQIETIGKARVEFTVRERRAVDCESPVKLTLAVALPKGDRQRWLVEKAVELGVACLIPLETQRGVAQPTAAAVDRLRRTVIEASKQCGRNHLMEIGVPQPWQKFTAAPQPEMLRLLAHPDGSLLRSAWPNDMAATSATSAVNIMAAIGPEGGFTDEEVASALPAGWRSVNLGPRILRVETAAVAVAAWIGLGATQTSR